MAKFKMYPIYYIQSAIENFIDSFRYINKSDEVFLTKSSKYYGRSYHAIELYYKTVNSEYNIDSINRKMSFFNDIRDKTKKGLNHGKNISHIPNYYNNMINLPEKINKVFLLNLVLNDIIICIKSYI